MKKLLIMVAALSLSGCTTLDGLTPCEKAVLAKMAADEILTKVCPLSEPAPESVEGVY